MDFGNERADLAAALRLAAHFGFSEGICNHFSLQVADNRFLLNPHGIHWSRLKASDILLVDPGNPASDIEATALNIHRAIHEQHPSATCVLHTHMPYATALTCLEEGRLQFVHQNSLRFYDDVSYDDDYGGLAETDDEGDRIAAQMSGCRVHFMASHGIIVTGRSVADAFDRLYYLERACEVQVLAMSSGRPLREIGDNVARKTRADFDSTSDYADAHFRALLPLIGDDYSA